MARLKSVLFFLAQSIVVGLAVAFVVVIVRPDLLPAVNPRDGTPPQPASYADAVDISAPAVASVFTRRLIRGPDAGNPGRTRVATSIGSAVVIDPVGYLVTNYHVVADAAEIRLQMSDGRFTNAEIVGFDAETDLAVLRVDIGVLPVIPIGRSDQLRIGDVVLAIGNPYGLSKTVTQGIVSATGRGSLRLMTFENFIQTDAAINEGNSGGALINSRGELVGINTAVLSQDTGTEGISFAIPVDLVRGVVDEIKEHGRVIRGYAGFEPDELTRAESDELGLDPNVGIILTHVYDNSPASRAGLVAGDVVLTINDEPIRSRQQALLVVAGLEPGDEVAIEGWRNGQLFRGSMIAGERPSTRRN